MNDAVGYVWGGEVIIIYCVAAAVSHIAAGAKEMLPNDSTCFS